MDQSLIFNSELIGKYDQSGPRYTSYPTALELHTNFSTQDYEKHIKLSNERGGPLSLYFHIPFCDTVCFYCACNKIVTKNRNHAEPYIQNLIIELELQGRNFGRSRPVEQLHWGGGTPTFLSYQQMSDLMSAIQRSFKILDDDQGQYSIEVDPRETQSDTVKILRQLGFNRISLGLQDFDPKVQKAVNRLQSEQQTFAVLEAAYKEGFRSTSIDLIYGLPYQTVASFSKTLDKVIAASPDRFSVFNYAHLPERFKTQRQIDTDHLPSPDVKLAILQLVIERLTSNGYVFIGMDHFAKPDDELALAQREGKLYRNFQGYSTHADCDLVALGITSIGRIGDAYVQNVKDLESYDQLISLNQLPLFKGLELTEEDKLRNAIISQLICHFELEFKKIEQKFSIQFEPYFQRELSDLTNMVDDGLLQIKNRKITVLPAGRLLIRNICMVFDQYLLAKKQSQFSKVI